MSLSHSQVIYNQPSSQTQIPHMAFGLPDTRPDRHPHLQTPVDPLGWGLNIDNNNGRLDLLTRKSEISPRRQTTNIEKEECYLDKPIVLNRSVFKQ